MFIRSTIKVAALVSALFITTVVPAALAAPDTVGSVDPSSGVWTLRDEDGGSYAFYYGNPGDLPFAGDWDCDGVDTPGLYRQSDGYVYLRNANTEGVANLSFFFGNPGDVPIAGDFNGDGCDTVSIYRPSESRVYIINKLGSGDAGLGAAEEAYYFGNPGDIPFTGDFNDNGTDTVGLYRQTTGFVYFRNTHTQGNADFQFYFGNPGDRFVGGDWNDNGTDSPGVFRPSNSTFYLKYTNTQGNADTQFPFASANMLPVAGTWGDIPTVPELAIQPVANGLNAPMMATAPSGDSRLFIVERSGTIKVLKSGNVLATPFLTIPGVNTSGEGGFLGLAFHPDFSSNGRFFVYYTGNPTGGNALKSRVIEYFANPASDVANPTAVATILEVDQPANNHNAGSINFGKDGYLYIPLGDGGASQANGQNPKTLLGSVVRLDIDGSSPYVAPGNPFNGTNGDQRVWANGLRNPFRSSIDSLTGDLYIGDVGAGAWEEVSVGKSGVAGLNYGWNTVEGNACHSPSSGCNKSGLTAPLVTYPNPSQGRSVVGGYVYRGSAMPTLQGTYFYADFFSNWVKSFRLAGNTATDKRDWTSSFGSLNSISGFGQDGSGELYIVTISGSVYKIVPAPS